MGLKKYYIDGSSVPYEDIDFVSNFIEKSSSNFKIDWEHRCSYVAFWNEDVNPSAFPELKHCKIRELP